MEEIFEIRSCIEILANDKIHTPDQVYVLQLIRNYNLHPLRARFTNVDQAWTKFKFDLDLGLAVIFVAPTQFRSNHELNSI